MAIKKENFNFAELDFDEIRSSIVKYLRGQSEFEDVDFEGPAIAYLVDALAYSQTYMAYHANMAVGETFLQSARLRENVVAKAKELGYIPHSRSASKSNLTITYTYPSHDPGAPTTSFQIPRGTTFSSNINKNFVTLEDYFLVNLIGTDQYQKNIDVYEGEFVSFQHTLTTGGPAEKIEIPSSDVFLDSLKVTLVGSSDTWVRSTNIRDLGPKSSVYFVQESPNGNYELYFGDGVIGENPGAGQVINIEYLKTSGPDGNGANSFELNSVPASFIGGALNEFAYSDVTRSSNGAEREDIESIRHAAPISYQAQGRGVTKEDYYSLLTNEFAFIESVNVWGGEENDPPFYGQVFISIKPKQGQNLPSLTKTMIENTVKEKFSIMAITPRVVDADYLYVQPNTVVTYTPAKTIQTEGQITGEIKTRIKDFFDSNVSQFDDALRYSKLINVIDETSDAIDGNTTTFRITKKFEPTPDRLIAYRMDFFNALKPGTIESIPFTVDGQTITFKDDGVGGISLFINGKGIRSRVGTVDYKTGVATLNRYVFRTEYGFEFGLSAEPVNLDIFSKRNALIEYDSTHTVTMIKKT